jgi:ATP-dependent DNA ligase
MLYLNGKDLRTLPLIERKSILKKLLSVSESFISITSSVTAGYYSLSSPTATTPFQ